ncbi:Endonuclease/Exonuclease/phosphatase family protein [Litoreibacter ascidiaceicola]|uniref:Endonuclease/Exonuclease/phosphatase family protein n=1 Tax=Litoreibacter ascidiaceicola TaxID=1486859 RepID=A0A1M5EQ08_9RHOB|nr:endonuclease/exonuclease/phosphatase family protein [Litoreibacter ascidiaceicola]SHF81325.1 Endonuclease/Exonuclease/phosphatase family protein [Litoreibacter ascidiaceicola]
MRIATYNVEWFTYLFDDANNLIQDGTWSSRYNVTKAMQAQALGLVFHSIDADAIMVIEAPDTSPNRSGRVALENFAEHFGLRTTNALIGYDNDTQQEIALLYDPNVVTAVHDPRQSATAPHFDNTFRMDLDIDAKMDDVVFSKPPLEVALTTKTGIELRLIGAHLKSKAPHGARNEADAMRISIANRRKQLAQCIWLRRRVTEHLTAGDSMIVLGDFNDGPGLDGYEKLFGRSGVEIVLGQSDDPAQTLFDPHAQQIMTHPFGARPTTSRFYVRPEKRYLNAMLDYIMVSADLAARSPKWHIWHPFDDPDCWNAPELREALLIASDHFPVTLDIDL